MSNFAAILYGGIFTYVGVLLIVRQMSQATLSVAYNDIIQMSQMFVKNNPGVAQTGEFKGVVRDGELWAYLEMEKDVHNEALNYDEKAFIESVFLGLFTLVCAFGHWLTVEFLRVKYIPDIGMAPLEIVFKVAFDLLLAGLFFATVYVTFENLKAMRQASAAAKRARQFGSWRASVHISSDT